MADKKYATAWHGNIKQRSRADSNTNAKYGFHSSSSSRPRTGPNIWRSNLGATNRYVAAGSMGSDVEHEDGLPSPCSNRASHAMPPLPALPALESGKFNAGGGGRETSSEHTNYGSRGDSDDPDFEAGDIPELSLEEAIGPLNLDTTAFVKTIYEVIRQPPTVDYSSADSRIPRFGTGGPLFMRDFYEASTNSEVFEPVSPAVYRRSLFPPTSPQKKRHQPHGATESPQCRMPRIDPNGLDLHRHFPPVRSVRLKDDSDSKAEIAFLSDLTIYASSAGLDWNYTPRQLVKVLAILNPRIPADPARSDLSGFWFTVQSDEIPTVESVETILYERGVKGEVRIFSPSSASYDEITETYIFRRNAYIAVQKPLLPPYNDEVGIWESCVGRPSESCRSFTKWADDSPAQEFLPREGIWGT